MLQAKPLYWTLRCINYARVSGRISESALPLERFSPEIRAVAETAKACRNEIKNFVTWAREATKRATDLCASSATSRACSNRKVSEVRVDNTTGKGF
jgi:hypothetical protein